MAKGRPTDPVIKAEILDKIKNQGMSAYKASQVYGVSYKTIRNWLANDVQGSERNLILENNRLKKELDNAYRVIGKLTTGIDYPKGCRP